MSYIARLIGLDGAVQTMHLEDLALEVKQVVMPKQLTARPKGADISDLFSQDVVPTETRAFRYLAPSVNGTHWWYEEAA